MSLQVQGLQMHKRERFSVRAIALQLTVVVALTCVSTRAAETVLELDPILAGIEQQRIAAIERATPSAVSVFVPGGGGGGSGVLISPDGYALTNFHVSSPAGTFMRCGLSDGEIYDAVIVGIDPVGDLAMIRLLGRNDFPYATLGDSRLSQVGDWCMVIGNPFLLASNLQPTVTWGILSGVGRYQYPSGTLLEYGDCLQTDASINPGNSGGPLYDSEGRLLGIVGRASFEKRGRVNVGVGYAISVQQAKNFLGYLRSGRIVDHATLGATVATDPDGGVRVSNLLESSDAYRRGLRYGAEILEVDGRTVRTANDVQKVLATLPNGWRVRIAYRSEGETRETLVRLMGVHQEDELMKKMSAALPPPPPRPGPELPKGLEDLKEAEEGEKPAPQMRPQLKVAKKSVPDSVQRQLTERKGYANYFFNQQQQDRIFKALQDQRPDGPREGSAESKLQGWVVSGKTVSDSPKDFSFSVSTGGMSLNMGNESFEVEDKSDCYDAVTTQSPLSILAALNGWRRMLEQGPKKFGESFFLGSMPLGGQRPLRDCFVGIDGELEFRWMVHPKTQRLEVIEVFADRDADPAELWFNYTDDPDNGRATPIGIVLKFGTEAILELTIDSWERSSEGISGDEAVIEGGEQVLLQRPGNLRFAGSDLILAPATDVLAAFQLAVAEKSKMETTGASVATPPVDRLIEDWILSPAWFGFRISGLSGDHRASHLSNHRRDAGLKSEYQALEIDSQETGSNLAIWKPLRQPEPSLDFTRLQQQRMGVVI